MMFVCDRAFLNSKNILKSRKVSNGDLPILYNFNLSKWSVSKGLNVCMSVYC